MAERGNRIAGISGEHTGSEHETEAGCILMAAKRLIFSEKHFCRSVFKG